MELFTARSRRTLTLQRESFSLLSILGNHLQADLPPRVRGRLYLVAQTQAGRLPEPVLRLPARGDPRRGGVFLRGRGRSGCWIRGLLLLHLPAPRGIRPHRQGLGCCRLAGGCPFSAVCEQSSAQGPPDGAAPPACTRGLRSAPRHRRRIAAPQAWRKFSWDWPGRMRRSSAARYCRTVSIQWSSVNSRASRNGRISSSDGSPTPIFPTPHGRR
jgi:hypothetical protein